jgi:precorrin-6B methylase 2
MKTLEESVVSAMDGDGSNLELFHYLPYILQDLWEIGSDPDVMIELIGKYNSVPEKLSILDLGSGKGAVSIRLAQKYGCRCHGIDGIPDFVSFSNEKARELGVAGLCTFTHGDIRTAIHELPQYDAIILGAIGPVLGNYVETLNTLLPHLHDKGIIIIDDAYIEPGSGFSHPMILEFNEIQGQIEQAGMTMIENCPVPHTKVVDSDDFIFESIKQRCHELMEKHPEKEQLFLDYIRKQEFETEVNATKAVCTVMVLKCK